MGIFDRLRRAIDPSGTKGEPAPLPSPAPPTTQPAAVPPPAEPDQGSIETESALRERARTEFATTTEPFESHDALATDLAAEGFALDRARQVLREEWDARLALARAHAAEDQSGAVRAAFTALRKDGVAASESLGFDNAEGHDLASANARATGAIGYVFFHAQDTERIAAGPGPLHLRYGAASYASRDAAGKYAEDEVIGRRVVAALEQQGLAPVWDGSGGSTIVLDGLRWYAAPGPSA